MSSTEIKNLGRTLHEDILKNEGIRMASSKHKEADKKRKAIKRQNETNLERNIRLEKMKKSIKLARLRNRRANNYVAWCDPKLTKKPEVNHMEIPAMDMVCSDCNALMFPFETHKKKPDGGITFSLCCSYGSVSLPSFRDPPPLLQDLLKSDSSKAKKFRQNIRAYNSMLSMASRNITGKETDFSNSTGPPVYKISGSMYHLSPNYFS